MEIEVEWVPKPKSGITNIDLSELGCKTKKEWAALATNEQEKRLNKVLEDTDSILPKAIEWKIIP